VIRRMIFPTLFYQILVIMAIFLISLVGVMVSMTSESLSSRDQSEVFGKNTFYALYLYYEPSTYNYLKEEYIHDIEKVKNKFPMLRISMSNILNATHVFLDFKGHKIYLPSTDLIIADSNFFQGLSLSFWKGAPPKGEGIIFGYEMYEALSPLGKIENLNITWKKEARTIFTLSEKISGILAPTPCEIINRGVIVITNKKVDEKYKAPRLIVFKVPREYMGYKEAIMNEASKIGLPVIQSYASERPSFFKRVLDFSAFLCLVSQIFIFILYFTVSKGIWLKESAIGILVGLRKTSAIKLLFLRNLIHITIGVPLGVLSGYFLHQKLFLQIPPVYYFEYNIPPFNYMFLIKFFIYSLLSLSFVTYLIYRHHKHKEPIDIIREVFYQ